MRSFLAAFLIAGLTLLPAVRLTPVGMPAGEMEARCGTCVHDHDEAGDAPEATGCCGQDADEPGEESPCRTCPPQCCLIGPTIPVAPPAHTDDQAPPRARAVSERPRDERAMSRALSPDPPVPIA